MKRREIIKNLTVITGAGAMGNNIPGITGSKQNSEWTSEKESIAYIV